jgi:hypothetical protein
VAYPTREDLVQASDVDELRNATETAQEGWYAVAKRLVERFCNQTFDLQEDVTVSVDASGGRRLALPRRLVSVSAITVPGSSIEAADVSVSAAGDALTVGAAGSGSTWLERALLDAPLLFPDGTEQVEITGDWGWTADEMPPTADSPVGIAIRLDMEDQALVASHGLAASVRAAGRMGVQAIQQGPLNARVERPELLLSEEAVAVLAPDYVWQPVAVVA